MLRGASPLPPDLHRPGDCDVLVGAGLPREEAGTGCTGHQLIRGLPPRHLLDALLPRFDVAERGQVHTGVLRHEHIPRQRQVGDGQAPADHERRLRQVRVDDLVRRRGPIAQKARDVGFTGLLQAEQEPQHRVVAGELVVVEQHPAPDLALFGIVSRAELAGAFGQVFEDQRRLGQGLPSMFQHRHLALLVDLVAPTLATGLAVEEVDEQRLPVLPREFEHEGGLVGVAGFGEAMQRVVGHGGPSLPWDDGGLASRSRAARLGQCLYD